MHQDAFRVSLLLEPFEGLSNTTIYDYFKADENAAGLYFYKHNPGVIPPLAFLDPILADYRQGQIDAGYHSVYSSLGQGQNPSGTSDRNDRKSTTSELQSLMRISYAVFCLKKKKH